MFLFGVINFIEFKNQSQSIFCLSVSKPICVLSLQETSYSYCYGCWTAGQNVNGGIEAGISIITGLFRVFRHKQSQLYTYSVPRRERGSKSAPAAQAPSCLHPGRFRGAPDRLGHWIFYWQNSNMWQPCNRSTILKSQPCSFIKRLID